MLVIDTTSGTAHHYRKLDADEQTNVHRAHLGLTPGRDMKAITESGLYKLIMRSDKEKAKPFQNWVTREVIPSIRKSGGYLLNEEARPTAHADNLAAMPGRSKVLIPF